MLGQSVKQRLYINVARLPGFKLHGLMIWLRLFGATVFDKIQYAFLQSQLRTSRFSSWECVV